MTLQTFGILNIIKCLFHWSEILIIGLLPEVAARCYQVNVIYQICLICSPVKLLFDGFVPRKQDKTSLKERESDAHVPYRSAYSSLTNVLCISDVLQKTTI